ncbi:Uncharacterised protein [Mycobacteroides abscessus subsp. abscessus]|nr:Uncharacterised protein [Mycobacteroides abscessus subsp. abscessus]
MALTATGSAAGLTFACARISARADACPDLPATVMRMTSTPGVAGMTDNDRRDPVGSAMIAPSAVYPRPSTAEVPR